MEDHIRATPYGILIRHIHHCQGHHVRYCDIVKFLNYDDVILWDEVKPSCNEVLSATSIFARRTWHHKVLFHQCWFGLILTKSYKQANVLTKVADFAQTKYCTTFHCSSVRSCVTGVTSHIYHIYKGINAIKPYIFWIKIILAIFLAKTRPDHLLRPDQPYHWFWL